MTDPERYVVTLPISAAAADVAGAPASFIERYVRSVGYPDGAQFSTNLDAASDLTAMKAELEEAKRALNKYAYERDKAREERDAAEARSEAFWKARLEAAEQERDELREALDAAFDFLGGIDGASEIRANILTALSKPKPHDETRGRG